MQFWALGGDATLNLTTSGGEAKVEFNCSLGQPGAPHSLPPAPAPSFPPPHRRPRHRGPSEKERNRQRAARHQAAKAAASPASAESSFNSASGPVASAVTSPPDVTVPVIPPKPPSPTVETLIKCELCEYTSTSKHGLSVHMGRMHGGNKKPELLRDQSDNQSLNILEDNETRNESQPLANSTIITYENVKPEEDKIIQTENSHDLVLP